MGQGRPECSGPALAGLRRQHRRLKAEGRVQDRHATVYLERLTVDYPEGEAQKAEKLLAPLDIVVACAGPVGTRRQRPITAQRKLGGPTLSGVAHLPLSEGENGRYAPKNGHLYSAREIGLAEMIP